MTEEEQKLKQKRPNQIETATSPPVYREELLALVDQTPLIAIKLDGAGRCVFINAGAERVLGKKYVACVGRPLYEVLGYTSRDDFECEADLQRALRGEDEHQCRVSLATDTGSREYLLSLTPGRKTEDSRYEVFVVAVDISAHHQVFHDLQEAGRLKERFISAIAHEFRNPLSAISAGLKILELSPNASQVQQTRAMMERQVRHLSRLVNDLLDVSRIKQGKIALVKSNSLLSDVLSVAVESSRNSVNNGQHTLHVIAPQEPILLYVDSTRLAQIIVNLIDNAAKYTPAGGAITLKVLREGGVLLISVSDNGVGIPKDRLAQIFEAYAQLDRNDSRAAGGLGIGLYLVKMFAEAHGGTVQVASDGEGKGSEFVVRIPLELGE
jgi:signal transduction histidine kinase